MKKAVTLMELLIAIGLLMVVILGATTFHFASTEFLRSSERKADVLNETTLIFDHLAKNVCLATGDFENQGIKVVKSGNRWTLIIRQDLRADINTAGTLWSPLLTPETYDDDRSVRYIFDVDNHTVTFEVLYSSGVPVPSSVELLTDRFVDLGGSTPFSIDLALGGVAIANFALRYNPSGDDRFYANVSMAYAIPDPEPDDVYVPFFLPFSHSQSLP